MAPIGHLLLRSHRRCLGFFFGQTSCGARQRSGSSESEVLGPSRLAKFCQNEFVELFWFFEQKKMAKKRLLKSVFDRNKKPRPTNHPFPPSPSPKKKDKTSFFCGAPKGNLGFRKWKSFPWLVVSTHLKDISQIGNLPQIGMKFFKKYLSCHLVPLSFPHGILWKLPPEPSLAASLAPSAKWYPAP